MVVQKQKKRKGLGYGGMNRIEGIVQFKNGTKM